MGFSALGEGGEPIGGGEGDGGVVKGVGGGGVVRGEVMMMVVGR